jgi:transposase
MPERYRERLRLVIYLYRSGISATEIGAAIGVTKQRVLAMLAAAGVARRSIGNLRRGAGGRYTGLNAAS